MTHDVLETYYLPSTLDCEAQIDMNREILMKVTIYIFFTIKQHKTTEDMRVDAHRSFKKK